MSRALATAAMRRAFASRFREVIERLAESVDSSTIEEALSMADALSGLSLALERAVVIEAAGRDPLAAARARGIAARERLIEKAGGVLRRALGFVTAVILRAVRDGHRHGADIMNVTGEGGGTVYKVLRRLEDRGLIVGRWEDASVAERERRPRRRYYRLTRVGRLLHRARYRPARGSRFSLRPMTRVRR